MDPKYIEHTLLLVDTSKDEVVKLCNEAVEFNFWGVCVPPYYVRLAKDLLANSSIKITTVVGFPFGFNSRNIKAEEAIKAIDDGADEIDMVMNISAFKSGEFADVNTDIESVATICRLKNTPLKVIIETGLLNNSEIIKACEICVEEAVNFVKTCTGVNGKGVTLEQVKLLRKVLPLKIKIKAAGGIRKRLFAEQLIEAGADRIGTKSGVELIK